jgi:hypothetical protein
MKVKSVWPGGLVELPEFAVPEEAVFQATGAVPVAPSKKQPIGSDSRRRRVNELAWWPGYLAKIRRGAEGR